jgi:hypothetical protein
VIVLLILAATAFGASIPSPQVEALFTAQTGVSAEELSKAGEGKVFGRIRPSQAREDVAVAGLMHVRAPLDFVLREIGDIEGFKKGPGVLKVHKFQHPPVERDFQDLTLSPGDIANLRECRPKSCEVKLSAEMMRQLRAQAGGDPQRAPALDIERAFRSVLFQYFERYLEYGRSALITYDDKAHPASLENASAGLLEGLAWVRGYAPPLWLALEGQHPAIGGLAGEEGFYYWSDEKLALKPVLSITQSTVWRGTIEGRPGAFFVSKQIYASHYFIGSVSLTLLIEDTTAAGPAVWMLYLNRSRVDAFGGWLGGFKRSLVNSRLPGEMRESLVETKRRLEQRYGAASARQ